MICPKCGFELKNGQLYCEACGEEIQMVPEFNPEIENSIEQSIHTVVKNLNNEETKEEISIEDVHENQERKKRKVLISVCCCFVAFITILAVWGGIVSYRANSFEYQYSRCEKYLSAGNFSKADSYYNRALEIDSKNTLIRFLIAEYFVQNKEEDKALDVWKEIVLNSYGTTDDNIKAYRKIINYYEAKGDYASINSLLLACSNPEIQNSFQTYMAKTPEFSYVEGNYAEVLPLKLTSNTTGTIYYTMDGSTPDTNSEKYVTPLFLETGEYVISAFFVNDYGIASEIVTKKYYIDIPIPTAPEVTVYSGEYTSPMLIEVEVNEGCSVYYTTNGTTPNKNSTPYTGKIPMPLGKSLFKFITYNKEGISGEITSRNYELNLNTEISAHDAEILVADKMLLTEKIADAAGTTWDGLGKYLYKFQHAIHIEESGDYYFIAEIYEDMAGLQTKSGVMYAVDIETGNIFRVTGDDEGNYTLTEI